MAFVSEYVSEQDIERYGLRAINKRYRQPADFYAWTIDKDRDVHLRWMGYEPFENQRQYFTLYWKGTLIDLELRSEGKGKPGGEGNTTWHFSSWKLPEHLTEYRTDILDDLKAALVAYKDFGVLSCVTEHTAQFTF